MFCCSFDLQALGSALTAGVLSFASPKESSQRKGDPWVGAGCAGSLRYSPLAGCCGTRAFGPQTVLAPYPPTPALLGTFQGGGKASTCQRSAVNPENSQKSGGVPLRLGDAEQRRLAGGFRLASVRAEGEFSQPPRQSSSAGNPAQRGVDSAVAFFLATFWLRRNPAFAGFSWRVRKRSFRAAKKYARRQGGT